MGRSDPGREAWTLLMELLRSSMDATHETLEAFELSSASANLLRLLQPDQPLPMVALAKSLRSHDSNVTGLVDRLLEAWGLIARTTDAKDRRVKLIGLTDAGTRLREQLLEKLEEPPPFIRELPRSDQTWLRDLLKKSWARED